MSNKKKKTINTVGKHNNLLNYYFMNLKIILVNYLVINKPNTLISIQMFFFVNVLY